MFPFREEGEGISSGRKGEGVPFLRGGGMVMVWDTAALECGSSIQHAAFIGVGACLLYMSLVLKDCFVSSMMIIDGKRASYIQHQ